MQDIVKVSPTDVAVLEVLAKFRYLTSAHMVRLEVSTSKRHLQRILRGLTQQTKPLVGSLDFGAVPTIGKLHRIYYLTDRGAQILVEAGYAAEDVKHPQRVRLFPHDYWHRVNCIDFHVSVALWAKQNDAIIEEFNTYYDTGKIGADGRAHPRSRVAWADKSMIPDAIFSIVDSDGTKRLFAFEMHNGEDANRIIPKLKAYADICNAKAIEAVYNYASSVRVLIVFENEKTLARTQYKAANLDEIKDRKAQYFASTLDSLSADFRQSWQEISAAATKPLF